MTQAYGHSHHSQFIVLPCCTAAQTRPVLNVALRSPRNAAIGCFTGRLGQLYPLPQAINLASGSSLSIVIHTKTKATAPRLHRWPAGALRGGGGGLGPKICVPKMAQPDFPCRTFYFFPLWSLWSGGHDVRFCNNQYSLDTMLDSISSTSDTDHTTYLSASVPNMPNLCVLPLLPHLCPLSAPKGGGGMWGIFRKPLKRAIRNTPGLHAILTICLRFLYVLDSACVVRCLVLSTVSHHVLI